MPTHRRTPAHYRGCLLAGAVGDALGAPVEFLSLPMIRAEFGPPGIAEPEPGPDGLARITDDTQMTLFTAEGLLRATTRRHERDAADTPVVVHNAYLRWLHTQGMPLPAGAPIAPPFDGWLVHLPELNAPRAPGRTCLSALASGRRGSIEHPINDSKGCGGIMRAAPVGLLAHDDDVFRLACETAALTHGHPSGYLAAGCLARIVHDLVHGASLDDAIAAARDELAPWPGAEECLAAIDAAVDAARSAPPSADAVTCLGEGWVADEALGIAIYCALAAEGDLATGLRLAVNHSGDSDSTGAITGNILGAMLGEDAIPAGWLDRLELREPIARLAEDLFAAATEGPRVAEGEGWGVRYPGW